MSSLILISGDEDFLVERAIRDEVSTSLIDEVSTYNMPDRLDDYLQDSCLVSISGRPHAYILTGVSTIPPLPVSDNDLLICVAKNPKKPLEDKRAKRSHVFPKLKSFSDNNEVIRWILREGENFNIDLSRVALALFVNCGGSLRKLASEIEKISVLVPRDSLVTPEEVRGLMCFSAVLTPQQILDAICDGNTIKALAFYDKLQEENDETGWIIAYLQRHCLQHLRLETLLQKGTPDSRISELLGIHPFIYRKTFLSRRGFWSKNSLLSSLDTLCELDLSHKQGDIFARFGLELEIIRLSQEAMNVKR